MKSVRFVCFVLFASACGDPQVTGDDPSETGRPSETDVPRALGRVQLGETHVAGKSESTPFVAARFVPDAARELGCVTRVEGCDVELLPRCGAGGANGCKAGEACVFDASCQPRCVAPPTCRPDCTLGEVCIAGACRAEETFDAGPIAFSGTSIALTLFPPYQSTLGGSGAPFLPGADIHAKAQGASSAGFDAFDVGVRATAFFVATPSLDKIPRTTLFGTTSVPIRWTPGADEVVVTLGGDAGSARCVVPDDGHYELPRAVVDRVLTVDGERGRSLSLSVTRQHTAVDDGARAHGTLYGVSAQPSARVELTTMSTESAAYEGCFPSYAPCGDHGCIDITNDVENCGGCDVHCGNGQSCVAGVCGGTGNCIQGPENSLARCSDGCSNDGDKFIDCDDFDCCGVRTDCPPTSACGKK